LSLGPMVLAYPMLKYFMGGNILVRSEVEALIRSCRAVCYSQVSAETTYAINCSRTNSV